MSRTVEKTVYTFEELDDRAKEKARLIASSWPFQDSSDWEGVYEDAAETAYLLGIDLRQRRVTLMDNSHRYDPAIYFSGFSSQGDGACFESEYRYKKGALKAITTERPEDKELARIAKALQEVQRRNFYQLRAKTAQVGFYSHSGCMAVDVYRNDDKDVSESDEEDVRDLLRDFADWIYSQLTAEYEYQCSNEVIDERLSDGYEFSKDGSIA